MFAAGATRTLVGTRAMLGEGWDAPCVNCLVDLSIATTPSRCSRAGAVRCGWTRPTPRRSPRTGTSSASPPNWPGAPATTSGSCASTCACSRPRRTARSRPGHPTCTRVSGHSPRRRPPSSRRSTVHGGPNREREVGLGALADRRALHRIKLHTLVIRPRRARPRRCRHRLDRAAAYPLSQRGRPWWRYRRPARPRARRADRHLGRRLRRDSWSRLGRASWPSSGCRGCAGNSLTSCRSS